MTTNDLDDIADSFTAFQAAFANIFGRKEARWHCGEYTRGLIVQSQDRCNVENLTDVVAVHPRVLQRFLTESRWSDVDLVGRLQAVMAPRLQHPDAVWVVDETGFVKQGRKSVGVARQYCGTLGKVGNCQVGVFLAYSTPQARLLVDKELVLPESWCDDEERCVEAGIPQQERTHQTKPGLALRQLRRAKKWGHLSADWVAGDDHYGQSPAFREGLEAEGFKYVLDVPKTTPIWPVEIQWQTQPRKPMGRAPKPKPVPEQKITAESSGSQLSRDAWRQLTIAQGSQGPRTYLFARERIRVGTDKGPGQEMWLVHRKNLDGSEPRYYLSNAPIQESLDKMARVAGSRWHIETEFEEIKQHVGLAEYEVRSWHGWHHHIALCLMANAFLLTVQQDMKKKLCRNHAPAGLPIGPRTLAAQALYSR